MDYLYDIFQLAPAAKPADLAQSPVSEFTSSRRRQFELKRQGGFEFTDAVRPSGNSKLALTQGFRYDKYVDEETKSEIPVIMAAASREVLFSVFVQLIQQLGQVVDVVLETSHEHEVAGHRDLFREHIDMPVLTSVLMEYESLLLNDGCTGIAVLNPRTPQEVQFDEHKLLIMYGHPLESFERVLERHGLRCEPSMHFIIEGEHIHATTQLHRQQFDALATALGTEDEAGESLET